MARPTSYNQEVLDKSEQYLLDYEALGDAVPSVEGLAVYLGISRETVYAWCNEKDRPEFSDIVNRLRTLKSKHMQNGGLTKKFDGRIASLLLGHEGYRQNQDITTNEKDLPTPILNVLSHNSDEEGGEAEEED